MTCKLVFKSLIGTTTLFTLAHSEQINQTVQTQTMPIIVSIIGLVMLGLAVISYVCENCIKREIVQFQSFQVSHPTPVAVISEPQIKQIQTFGTQGIKQPQFDSAQASAQHKKRKRKAHRLSDRRRNQQNNQQPQQLQQNSEL